MNLCFLIGKICSEIQFEFILNSKDTSIAMFNIELLNESIIKVKAYNETADYCYANLEKEMIIGMQGSIDSKMEIILDAVNTI